MTSANSALSVELSPPGARGRYQGVFGFGLTGAMFLGSALGGTVVGHLGTDALWSGVFCLGIALAMAHLAAGPARTGASPSCGPEPLRPPDRFPYDLAPVRPGRGPHAPG